MCINVMSCIFSAPTGTDYIADDWRRGWRCKRLPGKSSSADPIPTCETDCRSPRAVHRRVLQSVAVCSAAHFTVGVKKTFITQVMKKPGLMTHPLSCRPISNLPVLSKLLERLVNCYPPTDVVFVVFWAFAISAICLPAWPLDRNRCVMSALWHFICSVDSGKVPAVVLLDMSAAVDIVDHLILLQWLQTTFAMVDTVHQWCWSYLFGQSQCVRWGDRNTKSSTTYLVCGVPQGSLPGPVQFVLYTVDLIQVIESHLYADDTQV